MSYHASVRPDVKILAQHEQAAFRTFKAHLLDRQHTSNHPEINKIGNLVECFKYMGYICTRKKTQFIIDDYNNDEAGHLEGLWGVLARFVTTDSYIEVIDDSDPDDRIKMRFSKGKIVNIEGRWIYDDEGVAELKKIRK